MYIHICICASERRTRIRALRRETIIPSSLLGNRILVPNRLEATCDEIQFACEVTPITQTLSTHARRPAHTHTHTHTHTTLKKDSFLRSTGQVDESMACVTRQSCPCAKASSCVCLRGLGLGLRFQRLRVCSVRLRVCSVRNRMERIVSRVVSRIVHDFDSRFRFSSIQCRPGRASISRCTATRSSLSPSVVCDAQSSCPADFKATS